MTPHIEATKDKIAKTVIMPGDPLRAKYIAENFIENAELVNTVRGMYAYTGKYKSKEITVMASGMGIPSMGIYSYELFKFYDVESIIRIGTMGAYSKELDLLDVILVDNSYSKSQYANALNGNNDELISACQELNERIKLEAKKEGVNLHTGNILCSEVFYCGNIDCEEPERYDCLGVEMEGFSLFANAKALNKKAACILTVSDLVGRNDKKELTSEERQKSLNKMIKLALNSVL